MLQCVAVGSNVFQCVAVCVAPRFDWVIRVTWLIHICDMTHSYLWRDAFVRVTWLIYMCDMTHSCVRHKWLIHKWDMPHSCVSCHIQMSCLIHMRDMIDSYVTWLGHLSAMTRMNVVVLLHCCCSVLQCAVSQCVVLQRSESYDSFICTVIHSFVK